MVNFKEEEERLKEYENALTQQAQQQANAPYSAAMFPNQGKQNLIEWELDFKPELESIERLLRCDVLVRDKDGNEYWASNPNQARVFFNDLGVSEMISNIIILVNKNKALSRYTPEEINDRVRQIKHELRILIYNNYEVYGMDNEYKWNNYSMVVLTIGSIIEDVFRRAMGGATHEGLNEQRIVQQTEPLMPQAYQPSANQSQNKGGIRSLMPWTWFRK
jgi:hypothetical protein